MEGNLRTTAMGILPHKGIKEAMELVFKLDVPFFPQLPNLNFYEDMYAQTSANFPGIRLDLSEEKIFFDKGRFFEELDDYMERIEEEELFQLRPPYSSTYDRFLEEDLSRYFAIRGQVTGPVSFGFRVFDEEGKPMIYDEAVREILFDFIRRKVNVMQRELQERNERAFVWIDEPGLGWVFSGMSGYIDMHAKKDMRAFFDGVEGFKGLHLCAEVGLPYLLDLGVDILSFDAYQMGVLSPEGAKLIGKFFEKGGILVWGIVPTEPALLINEDIGSLSERLLGYWREIEKEGVPPEEIARSSMIAPARCLVKIVGETAGEMDEVAAVGRAFDLLFQLKDSLGERYL